MLAGDLFEPLHRSPSGARLLELLRNPKAEVHRGGRRGSRFESAIPGVQFVGDTVIDLFDGRSPSTLVLTWAASPGQLGDELRRRLRGNVNLEDRYGCVLLTTAEGPVLRLRLIPSQAITPLTDPVLTVRQARLDLEERLTDPTGGLPDRRLQAVGDDAFERRPEALLDFARLASRPGWSVAPQTMAAARRARTGGAPATAPLMHLGFSLPALLAAPEAPQALSMLLDLAPEIPLGANVVIDPDQIRQALAQPARQRLEAVLHALAPTATNKQLTAFREGARLLDPFW